MLRPIVVLWLVAPGLQSPQPAQLERWAAARGLAVSAPATVASSARHDPAIVEQAEQFLDEARKLDAAVGSGTDVFRRIDRLLLRHPELPQASWLMAERLALESRFQRRAPIPPDSDPDPRQTDSSHSLDAKAADLGGARAAVLGASAQAPDTPRPDPAIGASRFTGSLRSSDVLIVDGQRWTQAHRWSAGKHHVQVFRAGVRIVARWLHVGTELSAVLEDPTPACSDLDLLGTDGGDFAPRPLSGVACSDWLVARTAAGATEVSRCRRSSCSAWQRLDAAPFSASSDAKSNTVDVSVGPPQWLTWTAVGLGAALTTGLVLWQTGTFDRSPGQTEFVFTGPTAASLEF